MIDSESIPEACCNYYQAQGIADHNSFSPTPRRSFQATKEILVSPATVSTVASTIASLETADSFPPLTPPLTVRPWKSNESRGNQKDASVMSTRLSLGYGPALSKFPTLPLEEVQCQKGGDKALLISSLLKDLSETKEALRLLQERERCRNSTGKDEDELSASSIEPVSGEDMTCHKDPWNDSFHSLSTSCEIESSIPYVVGVPASNKKFTFPKNDLTFRQQLHTEQKRSRFLERKLQASEVMVNELLNRLITQMKLRMELEQLYRRNEHKEEVEILLSISLLVHCAVALGLFFLWNQHIPFFALSVAVLFFIVEAFPEES